ncbi:hypothetical protein M514_19699 [Trichuris suis]|uniref:C2H2-type domain-containing protein n=2 Tax=Trichuris suis TaxID=68888 RepID=A0A085NFH1_9BILA|nr:hypothetical protein M514_19699 [Trichuris suis]
MESTTKNTPQHYPERTAGGDGAEVVAAAYPGPFRCPLCVTAFTVGHSLTEHMRTHRWEVIFLCGRCSRSCPTIHSVACHYRKCGRHLTRTERRPPRRASVTLSLMSSLAKKKCRRYSVEYLAYGFVPSPRDQLLPMCLLCTCSFSNESMKPCKMKKHLLNAHPEYKDKPLEYFLSLKDSFHKGEHCLKLIGQCSQQLDKGILASYKISKLIAQTGNAHNVGESLILPSVSIIMSDVMNLNARDTVQAIPLSNSTVCRRIDEMAHDIEDQLNVIACATDGAASMVGRYRGFIAHLKRVLPSVFTIHCVIHREHLVSKKIVFSGNCEENNEDFDTLLLHSEVRWLSKGNCLQRFVALWKTIVAFMSEKEYEDKLIDAKADIFYLADMFEKFNSLNKALQGRDNNLMNSKAAVVSFLKKLEVYWHNIGRHEFLQFPNLKTIAEEVNDDDLLVYVNHLKQIQKDMEERCHDLVNLNIPDWIVDPFGVSAVEVDTEIQESLIDLQSDTTARRQFDHYGKDFWVKNDLPNKLPALWEKVQIFFIAFPSTYLVECGFRKVAALTKSRNRMDVATRGDLRLSLSNLEPDIMKLAKNCQPQGSH